jgi:hypothetical protein
MGLATGHGNIRQAYTGQLYKPAPLVPRSVIRLRDDEQLPLQNRASLSGEDNASRAQANDEYRTREQADRAHWTPWGSARS